MSSAWWVNLLMLTAEASNSRGLTAEQVSNLGSIRVKFFRAHCIDDKPRPRLGILPLVVDEIPEMALKGRDIESSTRYVVGN